MMQISIVAAVAKNGAIGIGNALPWHLPEDLAHFRQLTMGGIILMGRRTFESLPHGALPGRLNIVVSKTKSKLPGAWVFPSLQQALDFFQSIAQEGRNAGNPALAPYAQCLEIFVIGGASIYRQTITLANRLYLTVVEDEPKHADAFFPTINEDDWIEVKRENHESYSFVELRRRQ
jgi:dihydrofolate reductase